MAKLGYAHDTAVIAPGDVFEILPAGTYPVMIVESVMKPTKAGNGQYLELKMQVIDGMYKGRYIWDRLNVQNTSAKAQEIAQAKFSAICVAVGVTYTDDSEAVHNKPMLAIVKVQPEGPDSNGINRQAQQEVAGYKALAGNGPQGSHVAPQVAPATVGHVQQQAPAARAAQQMAPQPQRAAPAQPAWRQAPKA